MVLLVDSLGRFLAGEDLLHPLVLSSLLQAQTTGRECLSYELQWERLPGRGIPGLKTELSPFSRNLPPSPLTLCIWEMSDSK